MSTLSPALISANGLALAFGAAPLLEEVTLSVAPGEKVGLVGRNGCGKTCLLKILAGEIQADDGEISRRRGLRVGYLPQEFELDASRTVRENIEAGAADLMDWLRRYEPVNRTEAEMAELLHNIEQATVGICSLGSRRASPPCRRRRWMPWSDYCRAVKKRRVALCRALAAQPDLLLLDEPTNHLDVESILWLEEFLQRFPGSRHLRHPRPLFSRWHRHADYRTRRRSVLLAFRELHGLSGIQGGPSTDRRAGERRRQRFLRIELEWVRAGVRAQRSKSHHRLEAFYKVQGLEAPPEEREMDLLIPAAPELGNTAVELENAGAKVGEGKAERWLFRHLNFSLKPGQCTGVVGRNGVGKTTLLRLCLGERPPDAGTVDDRKG